MKSLVVALHTERKHYAFPLWVATTNGYERLLSLDADEREYAEFIERRYGVPSVLYQPEDDPRRQGRHRICGPLYNQAWTALLSKADGHTHLLCLDTDVIPSGDILALMEAEYGDEAFLRHGVPWRAAYSRPGVKGYETSCTFASVQWWRAALASTYQAGGLATLYGTVGDPNLFTHRDIDTMYLDHFELTNVPGTRRSEK